MREPALVLQELDEAVSRAFGQGGEPGPVYLDFPTDTLRAEVPKAVQLAEHLRQNRNSASGPTPMPSRAADLLWSARRVLIVSGRGARGAGPSLVRLLDRLGALYLDTGESRGLVPEQHASVVAAMRGSVMGEADVVVTLGRRLDFQLAYGSPAIYGNAKFLRIADTASELRDNRRGAVEILATPLLALEAILEAAGSRAPATDRDWAKTVRAKHVERTGKLLATMRDAPPGKDGRMHPNRLRSGARRAAGRRGDRRRRRRLPELRARRRSGGARISTPARSAASASARRSASPRHSRVPIGSSPC